MCFTLQFQFEAQCILQKLTAKPVIVISTHEIVRIHTMVEKHLAKLAPDSDDNLRVIMKDLGPVPPLPSTEKDIQLWLSNRFKADVPEV